MASFVSAQALDEPCHVPSERAHGLHSFLVMNDLTGSVAISHVPVLRADNGHVVDGEIFVETVKSC